MRGTLSRFPKGLPKPGGGIAKTQRQAKGFMVPTALVALHNLNPWVAPLHFRDENIPYPSGSFAMMTLI